MSNLFESLLLGVESFITRTIERHVELRTASLLGRIDELEQKLKTVTISDIPVPMNQVESFVLGYIKEHGAALFGDSIRDEAAKRVTDACDSYVRDQMRDEIETLIDDKIDDHERNNNHAIDEDDIETMIQDAIEDKIIAHEKEEHAESFDKAFRRSLKEIAENL